MPIINSASPATTQVASILQRLADGDSIDAQVETAHVDLKEEKGRRRQHQTADPGTVRDEEIARQLTHEAICMANSPGGGALIVGVSDSGEVVGTVSDPGWLRHRIYELSDKRLTPRIDSHDVSGHSVLVIWADQADAEILWKKKIYWRVGSHCVEVDQDTWRKKRMVESQYDWSASDSGVPWQEVRQAALEIVRDSLRDSVDQQANELAGADDESMLTRLNAVTGRGTLTQAAKLLFVAKRNPSLEYFYRDYAGGDSRSQVRMRDRSLMEEISAVLRQLDAHNSLTHVPTSGAAIAQLPTIPRVAAREAIANGVAHRDWLSLNPTVVEHIGTICEVTSPGGFYGDVTEHNLLTHPSTSRNKALTQLLADVKYAEKQGIGVDRMTAEMLRMGYPPPDIHEIAGPYVRTSLLARTIDKPWLEWVNTLRPHDIALDVRILILLRQLLERRWVDAQSAAPHLQCKPSTARTAIDLLTEIRLHDAPVIQPIAGVPENADAAWALTTEAVTKLSDLDSRHNHHRQAPSRAAVAAHYAEARKRISSTELGSIVGSSPSNVGSVLKKLQGQGLLKPSSRSGRGHGYHYRWVKQPADQPD